MILSIAQTEAIKGDMRANMKNHMELIERAIKFQSDIIVFPELSLTGYEPKLARTLAKDVDDTFFNPFQTLADHGNIVVGIGMPTKAADGINISMLLFLPNQNKRQVYSKYILHEDELPFFTKGKHQPILDVNGTKIAFGICYETLQKEHFLNAMEGGADIYVASVSKPDRSTDQAYIHLPSMAKEFRIPVLMVNSVGYSDDFLSNGLSSVWNTNGEQIGQLNLTDQGLLMYNTETNEVHCSY